MSEDILNYLTPEDRSWLHARGWEQQDYEYVQFNDDDYCHGFHVIRLRIPDEMDAYVRDTQYPPFTLLSHAIRDPHRRRMFPTLDQAIKGLGRLPRPYVIRLTKVALSINGLANHA